jgi:hypothetical protein
MLENTWSILCLPVSLQIFGHLQRMEGKRNLVSLLFASLNFQFFAQMEAHKKGHFFT